MKPVLFLAAVAALLVAPIAAGQGAPQATITTTMPKTSHGTDMQLPDTRKMTMEVEVNVVAVNFVCATEAEVTVEVNADEGNFPGWAGASVNPRSAKYIVPAGQPATTETKLAQKTGDPIRFEIFWGEDRPKENARWTYILKSKTSDPQGACAPDPTIKEGEIRITARMPDIIEQNTTLPNDCNQTPVPDIPECKPTVTETAEAKSPGFEAVLFAAAIVGAVVLLRRRR